jgi:hypothetical protein
VISFLTESASVKTASPIFIEKNELKVRGKGLSEYKKGANLIAPWEGGWWRLGDLVAYELSSTFSMLKTASMNRASILQYRNDICKKEYAKGKNLAPFYYNIPSKQHDRSALAKLVNLLLEHGITVSKLTDGITIENRNYGKGDLVVGLAQPFRAFIKEVLEVQEYPERHYTPNGEMIRPYDITSWSLPLTMGVNVVEINTRSAELEGTIEPIDKINFNVIINSTRGQLAFSPSDNDSYLAAFTLLAKGKKVYRLMMDLTRENEIIPEGSFVMNAEDLALLKDIELHTTSTDINQIEPDQMKEVKLPSIVLIESWFHDMDAGWTRFLFDNYSIPYKVLRPDELGEAKNLRNVQVLIFPNQNSELLMTGKRRRGSDYMPMNYPPEFAKGMGKKGKQNVVKFIDDGGKVIAWGQSTDLFLGMQEFEIGKDSKEEFTLPLTDVASALAKNGLEAIGCHAKVHAITHPITYGMPKTFPIFFSGGPVFETTIPYFDTDRRVILSFTEGDPRMSGYIKNGELLENKAALVWVKKNKGQLLLYGFNPQFRGQTSGTFKLVFNSLLMD